MKRATVLFLTLLIMAFSVPSMAATGTENTVSPTGIVCECGGSCYTTKTAVTGWEYTGTERSCIHYAMGLDHKQSRIMKTTHTCRTCGRATSSTSKEYRWYCKGYNS